MPTCIPMGKHKPNFPSASISNRLSIAVDGWQVYRMAGRSGKFPYCFCSASQSFSQSMAVKKFILASLLGSSVLATNYDGMNYFFPNSTSPEKFKISVDRGFIHSTTSKVKNFRGTRSLAPDWTNEGPSTSRAEEVRSYWEKHYDWFSVQEEINANFSHYATTVPGNRNYTWDIPLHFVHERSESPDAIPLLLLHGWPSTHLEWSQIIKPLASSSYGNVSFHVVAPDLPGFGFSPAPTHPGLDPRVMGIAFDSLMHQLGYPTYGIVTTDLGWFVGSWMAKDVPDSLRGHFMDFALLAPNATDLERFSANQTTPEETAFINSFIAFTANHFAYSAAHEQKPLALGYSMSDSPVGFLAWLWDLAHIAGPDQSFKDLITKALMLYIPGVYNNIRAYLESFKVSS